MKDDRVNLTMLLFISLVTFGWIASCTHTPVIDKIPEVCFERDVLPVFQNNCAISGCHTGNGESDFALNSYVAISHAVVAGKPYSSRVYNAIISTSGNPMPPGKPLSLDNRTIIRLWIEQGAGLTICPDTTGQTTGYVNPRACFDRDILPVLVSRCATAGCHDAAAHMGGYVFSSYSSTMAAVAPGNLSGSKLYEVIRGSGEDKMPPAGKPQLTTIEIDSIAKWIGYGALNQNCGEICDTVNPITFKGIIWPIMQTSCTGCHSGTTPSGGVLLSGYSDVAAVAANGLLVKSLKGTGVTRMPLGSSFSVCRIRQFEIWVKNGYLNN